MASDTTTHSLPQSEIEATGELFDNWFDPIEAGLRGRIREFLQGLLEAELEEALGRSRYARSSGNEAAEEPQRISGHRHGHRSRSLLGTFGRVEIAVPRARLNTPDGKTTEWKSGALRAYQRRTLAADALIAGVYLSGTNTRRVRRALGSLFAGAVGKDTVSRVWRKVTSDWDAWNARSLADEPIVRHPGRHGGAGAARPQSHGDLAARRHRSARRRPEALARRQGHGEREHRGLARGARRSHPARPAQT
jgi:hypothetical protein